jgi:hypothetical protein
MSIVEEKSLTEQIFEDKSLITKSVKQRRPSLMDRIREKTSDQDFIQKKDVFLTLGLELYRVLMGAFLVVFVPQKCDDTICSMNQNIYRDDIMSQIAIASNAVTMFSFLVLYMVEVKREHKLINYLEVNRFTPVDNESVGTALTKLAAEKKQAIWDYDGYYQKVGYLSTSSFILNAVLSSIVVYSHYLDSKTLTVYLTNLMFMGFKVVDVFSTVNTKKNVFYSAYLKNKVQFNDVDPDKFHNDDEGADRVMDADVPSTVASDGSTEDATVNIVSTDVTDEVSSTVSTEVADGSVLADNSI